MTAVTLTNGQTCEAGCLIAGHHGWRAMPASIYLAADLGFPLSEGDRVLVDLYVNGATDDYIIDNVNGLADDAEEWLNDHCPDGWCFTWKNGEFFLQPIEEDE